jgi:hypothetical protein
MSRTGRPPKGRTQRNYQFDRGIAAFIDTLPDGHRSDFVADLIELGVQRKLEQGLEAFIASPDFKEALIGASIAARLGAERYVELLPDSSWRILYYEHGERAQSKYESPGVMLILPPLDCAEMPQFVEDGGTEQEWYDLAFANERDEIEQELRNEFQGEREISSQNP